GLPYGGDALDWDLLRRLSDVRGVSGDEGRVRDLLAAHVEPHVDRLWTDDIGNLYAAKRGEGAQDRVGGSVGDRLPSGPVMLCAHLDEVGLIVTDVDADGMVRFAAVGGVLSASVVGQRVAVGPDGMPGVIGLPPAHATAEAARGRLPALAELRIDLGVTTRDAALDRVGIGDAVVWDTAVVDLGPTLLGKAFDDRAGCWALAMLLERRFPVDVVAVWSVQEETGLRGAGIAAHRLRPSAAIVLECGTTDDTPKERDETPVMRVGDGPAITVVDAVMVADERLVAHLVASAARAGVRHQIRAPKGGGTDGGRIHLAREGVPTAVVSAPCRYLHGPLALVSKHDLAGVVALVRAALDAWPDAARALEVHR
ncbi:MAG: hypothetical protein ABI780_10510, partial [Ardenticatenales bacterium]